MDAIGDWLECPEQSVDLAPVPCLGTPLIFRDVLHQNPSIQPRDLVQQSGLFGGPVRNPGSPLQLSGLVLPECYSLRTWKPSRVVLRYPAVSWLSTRTRLCGGRVAQAHEM